MTEKNKKEPLYFFIISDSAGETASKLAQATMAQYPTVEFEIFRRTFITTKEALIKALTDAKKCDAIILHTLINEELVTLADHL